MAMFTIPSSNICRSLESLRDCESACQHALAPAVFPTSARSESPNLRGAGLDLPRVETIFSHVLARLPSELKQDQCLTFPFGSWHSDLHVSKLPPLAMANPSDTAERLRSAAYAFCEAFVAGDSPTEILDRHFTTNAQILEHGPSWASARLPFLATTFRGRRSESSSCPGKSTTCDDYYDLLTSTLSFHPLDDTLPAKDKFLVDAEKKTVTVKLRAGFASVKTGKSWQEDFVYVLSDFDDDFRIGRQELWADPLSAWEAVGD